MPKSHQTGEGEEERMRLTCKAIASVSISHLLRGWPWKDPVSPLIFRDFKFSCAKVTCFDHA